LSAKSLTKEKERGKGEGGRIDLAVDRLIGGPSARENRCRLIAEGKREEKGGASARIAFLSMHGRAAAMSSRLSAAICRKRRKKKRKGRKGGRKGKATLTWIFGSRTAGSAETRERVSENTEHQHEGRGKKKERKREHELLPERLPSASSALTLPKSSLVACACRAPRGKERGRGRSSPLLHPSAIIAAPSILSHEFGRI